MSQVLEANVRMLKGDIAGAVALYREGARDGDPDCAFNYGYCLARGIGTERDTAAAKSYFVYAGEMEGEAYYNLAMLYMHGDGVPRNFKRAFSYMVMSAEAGCIEAQLYLGMAYTTGTVFEPDISFISMIPYHTPVYATGEERFLPGTVEDVQREEDERSFVVDADEREAFAWFQTAARHDPTYVAELVAKGKYLYAKCYLDGFGVGFDRMKAVRLMLAAGRSGSAEAVEYLSSCGITPDRYLDRGRG